MPTTRVTEVGHDWPDIFITGNVPADASDDLLGAHALNAWGCAYAGATLPPHFGDVMQQIAHRLNVSGTPQSFLDWSEEMNQDLIGKTVYWVSAGYIAHGVVKKTLNIISPNDTLIVEYLGGYEKTIGASRVHFDPLNAAAEARECAYALLDAANQLEKEASE